MKNNKYIKHLQNLISKAKLDKAAEELLKLSQGVEDDSFKNSVILQVGRLNSLNSDKTNGVISREHSNIETNRLRSALLQLISELSNFPEIELQTSAEANETKNTDNVNNNASINGDKNTVLQGVKANGNINITINN